MKGPIAEILLAGPRGFCAGVERAIDIVEVALSVCPPPVYVRREIVHNRLVVETLRRRCERRRAGGGCGSSMPPARW